MNGYRRPALALHHDCDQRIDGVSKPHQGKCARLRRRCCRRSGMRFPSATSSALSIPCGEAWVRVRVRVRVRARVRVRGSGEVPT